MNTVKEMIGPINKNVWVITGIYILLVRSFNPSSTGCNNPEKPSLLGPSRIWENPNNFRSNKVKNATSPNPKINKISVLTIHNIMID